VVSIYIIAEAAAATAADSRNRSACSTLFLSSFTKPRAQITSSACPSVVP